MERRLKTPDLFKFPYFEAICWYVAKNLLETLKGASSNHSACQYSALKALAHCHCTPSVSLIDCLLSVARISRGKLPAARIPDQGSQSVDNRTEELAEERGEGN